ncbi:protein translocase subunit SecF [Allosaccharopolyspora coralli]|uniref:Protein-export membrane protein SecF n=1 Tax=Allosaccharopolyspora coralli TaxID=2665642 RepID=A0A5Q3Q8V2_9PSEU|nr:protein translocase subunit SecF [Allosaccharopolyspora coralli]QGK69634.1 protein translocase subunit SecF [Allosaccharopolyspora coralli]
MTTPETPGATEPTSVWQRLHTGTGAFDIVGNRKRFYAMFALLIAVCAGTMGIKGFNFGIDFVGGTKIQMPAVGAQGPITTDQVEDAYQDALGRGPETVQLVGAGDSETIQIRTESLNTQDVNVLKEGLFDSLQPVGANGQPTPQAISDSAVSGTWGGEITQQAVLALVVFLVLVTVFLAFYFERWMAVAALVALLHDIVVTMGVYAILGFEVTPATVIGLLTILGFSLYDTVVVFDKVKENTRGILGLTRRTYSEAANLAVNQTLMRSINTSIVALLPVLGLLVVGSGLLGVGVLRDLALVQLTGMLAGVVSSVLLATPLLVDFKMRDPKYRAQEAKVQQRRRRRAAQEAGEELPEEEEISVRDASKDTVSARREREMAAASSPAARTGKGPESRPQGKSGRPTGKKRR